MMKDKTLLIIDDDRLFCDAIQLYYQNHPFSHHCCHRGDDALRWCRDNRPDVILLDQHLPDTVGIKLCEKLLQLHDQAKIIFITAYPSFKHAVDALRKGASDYLSKPIELEELSVAVKRAFKTQELEHLAQLQQYTNSREISKNIIIGLEGGLKSVGNMINLAAGNRVPLLITGETGTGKSVVAKAIHYSGAKKVRAFVSSNCAALPETLIESEFFGHTRGAFTGAAGLKKGLFETADGGTLFLDEIGEMPLHLQSKLLGVLDDGSFRRIGEETDRKVEVRIIAATNVDLKRAITAKKFREDLYYRMSVMHIHLPSLRERKEDIEPLAHHFMQQFSPEHDLKLSPDELQVLSSYNWPGNVRELKNIIERAIILRTDNNIRPSILLGKDGNPEQDQSVTVSVKAGEDILPLAEAEKRHIMHALDILNNNHTLCARALGVARSTLVRKVKQYSLKTGDSK